MQTIVIPVSKDRPEDDILELVELLQKQLPDVILRISDALIIETDNVNYAALFKRIAGQEIKSNGNGKPKEKKFICVDCGAPCLKPNSRCKNCGMKLVGLKNRKSAAVEVSDEQPDHP